MSETYEDIDNWEILKEYKKERLVAVNEAKDDYRKKHNSFKRDKEKHEKNIAKAESLQQEKEAQLKKQKDKNSPDTFSLEAEIYELEGEIARYYDKSEDYQHDIDLSQKREQEMEAEVEKLRAEIEKIKAKIKELKAKQKPKKKMAGKDADKSTEECPKKCRINNVKIACSHASDRGFKLEVPPHEPGMDVPYMHVVSSHDSSAYDIVDVDFGGDCQHGKKSSSPDSGKHKKFKRIDNKTGYCPRVAIECSETSTEVSQPSKVKFAAALSEKSSALYSSGTLRLVTDLIFKKDEVVKEYDLQFESCKGQLPYKARVISHPAWKWNFDLSFGYKAATSVTDTKFSNEKGVKATLKKLFNIKPKTFDKVESNGGWEATIKAGYSYDTHSWEIAEKWDFEKLGLELGNTWGFLQNIYDFFNKVNGFFEVAEAKNKAANEAKKSSGHKIAEATIEWPKIVIGGGAERVECSKSPEIGVKGSFGVKFDPLFGISGQIDVIQVLLSSMGGPFGKFLRKVSKMSIGTYDKDGELDKDKPYIETNLELKVGAKGSISGGVGFEAEGEDTWKAMTKEADLGGTNISGIVGLILTGDASVRGMIWDVKFAVGGEFKTTGASGSKPAGFDATLKPVLINNSYSVMGILEFTGLAIVYALYKKAEGAGAEDEVVAQAGGVGDEFADPPEKKTDNFTAKNEKKAIIFKRSKLLPRSDNNDTVSLDAYKTAD